MYNLSLKKRALSVASVFALLVVGCNNCEKMTEKVCSDLGADDCAVWKRSGMDKSFIPQGRGVNKACGMMMSDAAYPGVLKGARQQVAAVRKVEQAQAKVPRP